MSISFQLLPLLSVEKFTNMTELLTEDQVMEFREAFSLFDKTGSGTINATDFGVVMRSLGHNPSEGELDNMIRELDPLGKGIIDFPHFLELMAKTDKGTIILGDEFMDVCFFFRVR